MALRKDITDTCSKVMLERDERGIHFGVYLNGDYFDEIDLDEATLANVISIAATAVINMISTLSLNCEKEVGKEIYTQIIKGLQMSEKEYLSIPPMGNA